MFNIKSWHVQPILIPLHIWWSTANLIGNDIQYTYTILTRKHLLIPNNPSKQRPGISQFHMFCKWIHEFNWLNWHVSVREFTGFCEQIWCVNTCLPWNHELICHMMSRSSDIVPVLTQYDSCQTYDNRQNMCIHVNTQENTYWWSGTNYEPVRHGPTGSEIFPCLLGIDTHTCRY